MSYIPMIKGVGEEKWIGNGLRFATADEALAYAADLQGRWMGCKGGAENRHAGESTDPVSHVWRDGRVAEVRPSLKRSKPAKNGSSKRWSLCP